MKSYTLNIAGFLIRFRSSDPAPDLVPAEKFRRFIVPSGKPDLTIHVRSGSAEIPAGAERVFHAPYMEETDGEPVLRSPDFWSVWKAGSRLYIKTIFPLVSPVREGIICFSPDEDEWHLWLPGHITSADPFEYPLDGLVLYYLCAINGDILIHASGISLPGKGFMFSGVSGRGKSTMAGLWNRNGAKVIHDDRLIIRKTSGGFRMYNTPVYPSEEPLDSILTRIFLIEHGRQNIIRDLEGAVAVSMVIANCIQHNWDPTLISRLLEAVSGLCSEVPVSVLSFLPDDNVIDYILAHEGKA